MACHAGGWRWHSDGTRAKARGCVWMLSGGMIVLHIILLAGHEPRSWVVFQWREGYLPPPIQWISTGCTTRTRQNFYYWCTPEPCGSCWKRLIVTGWEHRVGGWLLKDRWKVEWKGRQEGWWSSTPSPWPGPPGIEAR